MNEAEIVDVALGILIEVKSAKPLMTRNSAWAEARLGPWSPSVRATPSAVGYLFFLLPLASLLSRHAPQASPHVVVRSRGESLGLDAWEGVRVLGRA
ncbi:cell cycle regulator of non-homologous end joining isoform X6 [Trachypithecus francoisi]|nr:cell cycle regulator of non-homologous end joining isoform X6 [Trachypithecus francoisi]